MMAAQTLDKVGWRSCKGVLDDGERKPYYPGSPSPKAQDSCLRQSLLLTLLLLGIKAIGEL